MSFEEQIISKDSYLSIVLPQMDAIMFIILQIFLLHTQEIPPVFSCHFYIMAS